MFVYRYGLLIDFFIFLHKINLNSFIPLSKFLFWYSVLYGNILTLLYSNHLKLCLISGGDFCIIFIISVEKKYFRDLHRKQFSRLRSGTLASQSSHFIFVAFLFNFFRGTYHMLQLFTISA